MPIQSVAGAVRPCAIALGTALTASQTAHAQSAELAGVTLDRVVVTAARGANLKTLDVSATTVGRLQVRLAPETTTDQVVSRIPGVFTSQQPAAQLHPTGQEFNIRGFGTTTNVNTLVTVDGVPMNDPYFRTVDWGQLPKASINRIEVIRGGGATSLWGDLAMGGLVNVVTEAPAPGDELVQVSYGSFNTYAGDVALGVRPSDPLTVGVTYDIAKTSGYDQTPARYRSPFMDATASLNSNLGLLAVLAPTAASNFYVKFLDHRINEDGLVWRLAHNAWDTDRVTVGGSTRFNAAASFAFDGWYGWNRMITVNASTVPSFSIFTPNAGAPYVSQRETLRYDSYGGSAYLQTELGPVNDIKVGADFRSVFADDPLSLFSQTGLLGQIEARAQHRFEGLFVQGVMRPASGPLELTLGLREDFWQASDGQIAGAFKGSAFASGLANQAYAHFDPRLGAKLQVSSTVDLRAAVYENFAAPGMNQMYRSFISGANYSTSDPQLKAQTNQGEEAGIDVSTRTLTLSATGFYNRLANFIDYATVKSGCAAANAFCGTGIAAIAGGSLRQYVNAGNAVFRGFELLADWAASNTLRVQAGFTRTQTRLTSSRYATPSAGVIPDPVGQQIGQVPAWIATAGATWRATARLTLTADLKSFPPYWNNTSHTQKNDGATIFDLGASYRLDNGLELFGSAQNVGDVHYYDQGLAYTTTDGSTASGSTTPALGLPFDLTAGLRATF